MHLVMFSRDWADEFQAEGLRILDDTQLQTLKDWIAAEKDFDFGTNEGFEAGEISESDFTFQELNNIEVEVLVELLPKIKDGIGQFPCPEYMWYEDEDLTDID